MHGALVKPQRSAQLRKTALVRAAGQNRQSRYSSIKNLNPVWRIVRLRLWHACHNMGEVAIVKQKNDALNRGSSEESFCAATSTELIGVLLLYDFNRADRWVVHRWSEVDLDFTLRRGFNMLEGFDQWLGAGFPENIKSL